MNNLKYLKLLAKEFPTIEQAANKIISLTSLSVLPKGTEYFLSDLHGQYDSFNRIIKSASGNTRIKIDLEFKDKLSESRKNQLANLIYDPKTIINITKENDEFTEKWIRDTIFYLIRIAKRVASKYSRQKVRNQTPFYYRDLIDEMLNIQYESLNKKEYFNQLLDSIIKIEVSEDFIINLCELIQDLNIDWLHIVGDIFDRGKRPDIIMDTLIAKKDVDIQYGNHDVTWMGAYLGSYVNACNVVRNAISYNNFQSLEDGYGINLRLLSTLADESYYDDPCERFKVRILDDNKHSETDLLHAARMHKAISIIQFKLENQLFKRNPEFEQLDRLYLERIDFKNGIYKDANGKSHALLDIKFPTINPDNPLELTPSEQEVIECISKSFRTSHRLKEHMDFLFSYGSVYKIANSNLLFHGCIPMNKDGSFEEFTYQSNSYSGKSLLDFFEGIINSAKNMNDNDPDRQTALDFFWYMWCGPKSPMFGKSKISTFENFFITDKDVRKEVSNPYFSLSKIEKYADKIFEEFNMNPETSHIINGHVPVKSINGEKPVSANGKTYVIDGGISEAYQKKTGIAGYTLTFNSHHLAIAKHKNFQVMESVHGAYTPEVTITEEFPKRMLIKDTDEGEEILELIEDLESLIEAYRSGTIQQNSN
ncbi:MAG: fructose-1,6-bisphosphatase [Finegoldia magna]|uniref:fructose-1,6-bisphosphatase n=1 Tax=Finegoldia sp. TaxID=1981334 RepID=UPI0025E321B4|nr:fructose-1,6-bisphosphatase [uncultured Finegoldia sp.]MDU4571217.1 fructose-1,6-bisphosphatase [Finegoldia magna]MDU5998177.1 fructose-1,6-bisphosphatase [Finegoldia magna]